MSKVGTIEMRPNGQNKTFKSVRLFESDYLERSSHVHPITPLILWTPVIAFFLWRSIAVDHLTVFQVLGMGLVGFVTWTLSEYVLHRYIFHYKGNSPFTQRVHYIIHGNHHDIPDDPTRLVMPPVPGVIIATVLFMFYRSIVGPVWIQPFFGFFLIGYLCYDYTHYAVHHFKPRTALGKMIKQHHMLHHFASHEARWGVSSPIWDHVFGTSEEKKDHQARKSPAG